MYFTHFFIPTSNFQKDTDLPISVFIIQGTFQEPYDWASLVAQWLRIRLPMQGTRVRSLVWEVPTCCRTAKPVCHNY